MQEAVFMKGLCGFDIVVHLWFITDGHKTAHFPNKFHNAGIIVNF